jgi:hypothetical protein
MPRKIFQTGILFTRDLTILKTFMFFILFFSVSSYASGSKYSISLDVGPSIVNMLVINNDFGIGGGFEMGFTDNLSALVKMNYFGYKNAEFSTTMLMPGAEIRYYFSPTAICGFWMGAGFQLWIYSLTIDSSTVTALSPFADILIGYKWTIGEKSGFLVEPYLGLGVSFGGKSGAVNGHSAVLTTKFYPLDTGIRLGFSF